jgi:hypothetical protein
MIYWVETGYKTMGFEKWTLELRKEDFCKNNVDGRGKDATYMFFFSFSIGREIKGCPNIYSD